MANEFDPDMYAAKALRLDLADRLAPKHTALIVVDMQNDFCAPQGYIDKLGLDVSRTQGLIEPINRSLAAARAAGVPVIWLTARYEDDLVPQSMVRQKRSRGIEAVCCAGGSWGGGYFGVEPALGERMFEKHSYSGFGNPALEPYLRAAGIETLLFCGVQTNVCVESTLRDGHSRGFNVGLVADAVGSHTPALHDATLANVRFLFGDLCQSADLADLWPAGLRRTQAVAPSAARPALPSSTQITVIPAQAGIHPSSGDKFGDLFDSKHGFPPARE